MAEIILRFEKAVCLLGILYLVLFMQKGTAKELIAGGTKGWSVPSNPNEYNQWAEKNRFQTGDSLVFNYQPGQDSVQLVSSDDYNSCNTDKSIQSFTDGHTVFTFNHSGPCHFISGNKDKCIKNEKLLVVVLAQRSKRSMNNQISPTSSPATVVIPSPLPAPIGPESPPPTVQLNPTPASANEPAPPNGASTVFISFAGYMGALMATTYIFF